MAWTDSLSNYIDNHGAQIGAGLAIAGGVAGAVNAHSQGRPTTTTQRLNEGQTHQQSGSSGTVTQNIWQPQEQALQNTFLNAQHLMQRGGYQGDRVATWNPYQKQVFQRAQNYYDTQAPAHAETVMGQGENLMQDYGRAQDVYHDVAANGGVTPEAINAIRANQQPLVDQQVNAMTMGVNNATDQRMAQLREQQAGSNGLSGTRGAVQQGIVTSQGNNTIANNTAGIYQNAYNQATTQANQNVRNEMSAANNMASLGNQGAHMYQQGAAMYGDNLNSQARIGNSAQTNDQNRLNNEYSRFASPWDVLGRYNQLTGNRAWGGSTTTNQLQSSDQQSSQTGTGTTKGQKPNVMDYISPAVLAGANILAAR